MTQVAEKTAEQLAIEEAAQTAEEKQAEIQALKDFTEGFSDLKVEPTAEEKATAETAAKEDTDRLAAEEAEKAKLAAEPVQAKITQPEFLDLVAKANSVAEIRALAEKVRDQTNGRVGSLEQTIKKLQEATPIGQAIVATPEDFKEIGKDMPEHAKMLADGLTRILSKFTGTGVAPAPVETPEQFEERVNLTVNKRETARLQAEQAEAIKELEQVHPDWRVVIGKPDSNTEFRQYLETQSPLYKKRMLTTGDSLTLAEGLTKFKEFQIESKKPKPKIPVNSGRQDRLREAVPLRGGATPPNTNRELTPEEQFAAGFTSD